MICLCRIVLWGTVVLSVSSSLTFFIDTGHLILCQPSLSALSQDTAYVTYILGFLCMVVEKACIKSQEEWNIFINYWPSTSGYLYWEVLENISLIPSSILLSWEKISLIVADYFYWSAILHKSEIVKHRSLATWKIPGNLYHCCVYEVWKIQVLIWYFFSSCSEVTKVSLLY